MAMAMLARALSLRRANQRAKATRRAAVADIATGEYGTETSPDQQSAIHSSRVSQSIDALYVLSCLRDGLSLANTFTSDEDTISLACYRLSDEKLTVSSSLSVSEHARSSDAWDRFSSSLSSSGSDSVESTRKDAVRYCNNGSSNTEIKSEDFCLVFNTDLEQLSSSPSPPAAVASDCCSFLISRKSNHNEDDLRGFAQRDQMVGAAANDAVRLVQRRDKLRQNNCRQGGVGAGTAVSSTILESRFKPQLEDKRDVDADDDLQSFLREGAIKALEKQSCNPYQDFRESMLQMMMSACTSSHSEGEGSATGREVKECNRSAGTSHVDEMNIEDLLYCYLRLNSMELHELITQAFSDTCSDLLLMKDC